MGLVWPTKPRVAFHMDGLQQFDLALLSESGPAQETVAAVLNSASVVVVSEAGSTRLLRVVGLRLGAVRTRVLHVRPSLELADFMEQVASASPAPGQCALERGFECLTALDPNCDRIVLLVEDAHLLPHPTLRYIEMALRAGPNLQIVLAGQPALTELLALPGFAWLRRRLSVQMDAVAPQTEALPAEVVSISAMGANIKRRWRPAALTGALAASVAIGAWSLHSFTPSSLPGVVEALASPATAASSIVAAVPDGVPAQQEAAPAITTQGPDVPAVLADAPVPDAGAASASITKASHSAPAPTSDAASIPEPAAPITVTQVPEAPALVADAPVPDVTPDPALMADAPHSTPPTQDAVPTPEPAVPVIVTQVPEPPVSMPPAVLVPGDTPSPAFTADTGPSTSAPDPTPVAPAVVTALPELLIPVPPVVSPVPPMQPKPAASPPVLARQVIVRPAPIRPERVAALPSATAQNERRCRDIVLRAQLGDAPDDGDRTFLRNGCR